ncbi:DUF5675 family protein [Flammeovirga sp. OC4]|uniref:DUF5675 family protein n=1 Tax=Flammeovirga sp. OC4 TaxID=1382345 RepID=UPI000693A2CA|nr:DUF5675 family protein [Flammeovirga sp. OC4]
MKAMLFRLQEDEKQTLGVLKVYDGLQEIFECKTLELADKDNQRNVSRIPSGHYQCVPRYSRKYGHHYHITGVPNRSLILIHTGNFNRDIRGCVIVGSKHYDIDQDGYKDVTSSRLIFNKMKSIVGREKFTLDVV